MRGPLGLQDFDEGEMLGGGVNLLQELFQGDLVVVALVYKHLPLRGASLVLRILQDHASSHEQIQVR